MSNLTYDQASALLAYDPETGDLTWKAAVCNVKPGDRAGTVGGGGGYLSVQLGGRRYQAHRLAWLLMTGVWPTGQVDHRDGSRINNKWSNLRDVTQSVNQQNQRQPHQRSTTGLLGVRRIGRLTLKPFTATIKVSGRNRHLGCFTTAEEAYAAYLTAKRQLHEGNTL